VVPLDKIKDLGQLMGALFFQHIFGGHWTSKIFSVLVALSCVGNIVSGIVAFELVTYFMVQLTDCSRR
jgi:hypothetical protein